ncbi:MAG: zinc-dependent metalloprotease, partial [Sandaracinaceae bacterium]
MGKSQRIVALALLLFGCANAQPAVNRVGNDVLDKSAFEGEWYYLQTVIDTPYSIPYTFVGEQSVLERIEWEIQEDILIARRSYEFVSGAEGEGIAGAAAERGAPIAVYRIESHFDIRREFNTITGEQENVVVEATDRPWNQRQFMRVDWSTNLITDSDFLAYARVLDGVEAESIAYHINDPAHPDAPTFGFDEDGRVNYFDIVNRMLVRPTTVDIEGYSFPTCWLEYSTHVDCAPAEIGVRRSYLRVDDDARDYEPRDYSGDRMERFGFFVTERAGYDPEYGAIEPARAHWINRHNLWRESHRRAEDGTLMACTVDEDCADRAGSVCDRELVRALDHETGACTIPLRERVPKPIVYYLSERFPEDLHQTADAVIAEWNDVFEETVGSMRVNECLAEGLTDESCAVERAREDATPMFVLCSNPVTEDDPDACGEVGTVARIGDLRYSLLAWVPEPHEGSPLGYGPSSADPRTGEIVQANAFIYGAGIETLASYARDLVALLNGDLAEEEVSNGAHIARWLAQRSAGRERTIPLDGADAHRIEQAIDVSRITGGRRAQGTARSGRVPRAELRRTAMRSLADRGAFGLPGSGRARLDALRGTPLEAMLLDPDITVAGGFDPDMPFDDSLLDLTSPLRGMSLDHRRALHEARRRLMRERCVLRAAEFADDGLLGLAQAIRDAAAGPGTMEWYGQTFTLTDEAGELDYDAVRSMLRHPVTHSTSAHEVGHTLGLRHNFSGSYDSINYHPGYWALRDDGD